MTADRIGRLTRVGTLNATECFQRDAHILGSNWYPRSTIVENSQPREWDSLARRIEPYGSAIRRLSFHARKPLQSTSACPVRVTGSCVLPCSAHRVACRCTQHRCCRGKAQFPVPVLQRTEGKSKAERSKRRGPLTQLPRQPQRQATLIVERVSRSRRRR
jgi:hypothetical protein